MGSCRGLQQKAIERGVDVCTLGALNVLRVAPDSVSDRLKRAKHAKISALGVLRGSSWQQKLYGGVLPKQELHTTLRLAQGAEIEIKVDSIVSDRPRPGKGHCK